MSRTVNINEIEIDKAVPAFVAGSVTVTQPCMVIEARVQVFVDDVFVREEAVYINCIEEATIYFEYTPDQPLKPETHELRIEVPLVNENLTAEETIEFQVPSGRGPGKDKSKEKGKGREAAR